MQSCRKERKGHTFRETLKGEGVMRFSWKLGVFGGSSGGGRDWVERRGRRVGLVAGVGVGLLY